MGFYVGLYAGFSRDCTRQRGGGGREGGGFYINARGKIFPRGRWSFLEDGKNLKERGYEWLNYE